MRTIPAAFAILLLAAAPGLAQPQKDKLEMEQQPAPGSVEDAIGIMDRTLPFRDGQTLRYIDPQGKPVGHAQRRRLTIRFYDENNVYQGRAERVSQETTVYYAPDGTYLGRRLHRKMTLQARAMNNPTARGFLYDAKPQPNQD